MFRIIASCLCLMGWCLSAAGQTNAPAGAREMSLADCIRQALEHNFEVQIERYNPEIRRFNLDGSYEAWEPELQVALTENFNKSPTQIDPTLNILIPPNETTTERFRSGVVGQVPFGMTYDVGVNFDRSSGSRFIGSQHDTDFAASLRQPLLKDFWIDGTRQQIQVRKRDLEISELALRDLLIDVVTQVQLAYYDLIFAYENVAVHEKSLQLAQRLLEDNRKRVKVGTMAPLEEKQAESQVAARRADLLSARHNLSLRQNALKNLLTDRFMEWHAVDIAPSEKLVAVAEPLDPQDSWNKGIALRPDLLQLKQELEKVRINLRYDHNQLFPALDLVASYGHNGLDSTVGGSLNEAFRGRSPFYTFGAEIRIPLSNRAARNRHRATEASKKQALLRLKQLEQNVIIEIDNAIKQVQTNYERVEATREARRYSEAALEAEEKKLANGASTSFVVLELQRDLTDARSAEIQSLADYLKSLAELSRSEGDTLNRLNLELDVK